MKLLPVVFEGGGDGGFLYNDPEYHRFGFARCATRWPNGERTASLIHITYMPLTPLSTKLLRPQPALVQPGAPR